MPPAPFFRTGESRQLSTKGERTETGSGFKYS